MIEYDFSNPILKKSKLFLSSRKNSNELVAVLSHFQDISKVELSHILAIQLIFEELHKKKQLSLENINKGDAELKYCKWLLDCYKQALTKLLQVVSKSENDKVQQQGLTTILLLLEYERCETDEGKTSFIKKLSGVIEVIAKYPGNIRALTPLLKEYIVTKCNKIADDLWRALALVVQNIHQPDGKTVSNVIFIIDSFPKENSKKKITNEKDCKNLEQKLLCSAVTKVWDWCLRHHQPKSLKILLITLLEHFMPLLNNPIYLTDFLINSLNIGGATSLLALQGIFVLILKHNIDYPNIYGKLYTMLQPEIFRTKYKARFFYLLDLFLNSTHLPEQMVASFAKRLSRLALRCPPHDIFILLPFIGNLLTRHPGLKKLINHPAGDKIVDEDPFVMEEIDPMKTQALNSSLWEVKSLQQHLLPSVSKAAMFINEPLPSVECDLSDKLETTSDKIFDREIKKKMKTVPITFERPSSISVPRGFNIRKIWSL